MILTTLLSTSLLALTPQQENKTLLTLEQTSGRGESVSFAGKLERWAWASDGVHLVRGRDEEARWIDPVYA